jgi:hypothetical protein
VILAASLLSAEAGRSHGPKVCEAAVADRYVVEPERERVAGGLGIKVVCVDPGNPLHDVQSDAERD